MGLSLRCGSWPSTVLHPLQPDFVSHLFTEDVQKDALLVPPAPLREWPGIKGLEKLGKVFTQDGPTETRSPPHSQPTPAWVYWSRLKKYRSESEVQKEGCRWDEGGGGLSHGAGCMDRADVQV